LTLFIQPISIFYSLTVAPNTKKSKTKKLKVTNARQAPNHHNTPPASSLGFNFSSQDFEQKMIKKDVKQLRDENQSLKTELLQSQQACESLQVQLNKEQSMAFEERLASEISVNKNKEKWSITLKNGQRFEFVKIHPKIKQVVLRRQEKNRLKTWKNSVGNELDMQHFQYNLKYSKVANEVAADLLSLGIPISVKQTYSLMINKGFSFNDLRDLKHNTPYPWPSIGLVNI